MTTFSQVDIDRVRAFWNNRPCNIKHSNKEVGTKDYFDEVEYKKYKVEPHLPQFADFHKYNGKKVLEIGCGIGTDSINFVRAGADLTIVELSSNSLDVCKKRFEVYGLSAHFYEGNVEHLSTFLPVDQYDLIYSWGVIHHTPHPEKAVSELTKYLKIGGELKLMVYSKFSYKLFWIMKETDHWDFGQLNELLSTYSEAQTGCPVTYSYTFDELSDLLKGYEIKKIYKDHIFPYKIEKYVKHEYELEDCFKYIDPIEFKKMEKELGWHTMVIAVKPY